MLYEVLFLLYILYLPYLSIYVLLYINYIFICILYVIQFYYIFLFSHYLILNLNDNVVFFVICTKLLQSKILIIKKIFVF